MAGLKLGVKTKEFEQLSDANIEKVIALLNAEKPITKKTACEILNISYNTSRLDTILRTYVERKELTAKRYAEKRGKKASIDEIAGIITSYLEGDNVTELGKRYYRSDEFIKRVLVQANCPLREQGQNYWNVPIIPEEAVKQEFAVNDKVYAARYQSLATVKSVSKDKNGDTVCCIWLDSENWQQYAYQPWWELASLEHLTKLGIKF